MRCIECDEPLVSVLERSRRVCAACYLRHRFRAEHSPPEPIAECLPNARIGMDVDDLPTTRPRSDDAMPSTRPEPRSPG